VRNLPQPHGFQGAFSKISRTCPACGCVAHPRIREIAPQGFFSAPIERSIRGDALAIWVERALGPPRYRDTCPLTHYRFFFFLLAKMAFQLSLYAFVTAFWPSPRL
jgi:hypothetical protein